MWCWTARTSKLTGLGRRQRAWPSAALLPHLGHCPTSGQLVARLSASSATLTSTFSRPLASHPCCRAAGSTRCSLLLAACGLTTSPSRPSQALPCRAALRPPGPPRPCASQPSRCGRGSPSRRCARGSRCSQTGCWCRWQGPQPAAHLMLALLPFASSAFRGCPCHSCPVFHLGATQGVAALSFPVPTASTTVTPALTRILMPICHFDPSYAFLDVAVCTLAWPHKAQLTDRSPFFICRYQLLRPTALSTAMPCTPLHFIPL